MTTERQSPIVCRLDPSTLATRRAGLLAELLRQAGSDTELADGRRFTFRPSSDTLALIGRVVDAERQCCRFLRFQLTVEPDLGAFVLELTGPPGTAEFLASLL